MNRRKLIPTSLLFVAWLSIGASTDDCEYSRMKIVTYNSNTYHADWRDRFDQFAEDMVSPHRPAIIAMQEVYLRGDCFLCSCESLSRQAYLRHLLDRIETHSGLPRYKVANSLRVHDAQIGHWCHVWEGTAVLFDPAQVDFIPYDIYKGDNDCLNWAQEDGMLEEWNDCLDLPFGTHPMVSRTIFRYPKGSDNYLNFYNTHLSRFSTESDEQARMAISFISTRHAGFQNENLPNMPTPPGQRWQYPPIWVGDMNRSTHSYAFDNFDDVFPNYIEKILVGKETSWDYESLIHIPADAYTQVFSKGLYSDHSVPILEVEAIYPAQ